MDPSVTTAWLTIFDVTFIETSSDGPCSPSFGQFFVERWRHVRSDVTSRDFANWRTTKRKQIP